MFWILLTGRTLILCFYFCTFFHHYFCSGKAFLKRYEIADLIQLLCYRHIYVIPSLLLFFFCFLYQVKLPFYSMYLFIYLFVFCSEKALFKSYLIADI